LSCASVLGHTNRDQHCGKQWKFGRKVNVDLPCDRATSLLHIPFKEGKSPPREDICVPIFTMGETWEQVSCLWTGKCVEQQCCIRTMEGNLGPRRKSWHFWQRDDPLDDLEEGVRGGGTSLPHGSHGAKRVAGWAEVPLSPQWHAPNDLTSSRKAPPPKSSSTSQ
jgi:hypothetical protein